jgi:hypothetical protein
MIVVLFVICHIYEIIMFDLLVKDLDNNIYEIMSSIRRSIVKKNCPIYVKIIELNVLKSMDQPHDICVVYLFVIVLWFFMLDG